MIDSIKHFHKVIILCNKIIVPILVLLTLDSHFLQLGAVGSFRPHF